LNNTIPASSVPTAPMPVHTAYAVPTGKVTMATDSRYRLPARKTMVAMVHGMFLT
jgi:hypothetical protein